MTLADDPESSVTREELCLKLMHRAFAIIERRHEDLFMSNLEIFTPNILAIDLLPANLDAPTVLIRASVTKIENLVSIGQNCSSKLYLIMTPAVIDWLAESPLLEQLMEDVLGEPIFNWLSIAFEVALAIRAAHVRVHYLSLVNRSLILFPIN